MGTAVLAIVMLTFSSSLSGQTGTFSDFETGVQPTTCTVSPNSNENTSTCKKKVDGSGNACVTPGFWDSKNCNGQQ